MRATSIMCSADNKAIRYGIAVGEEALSWYGIAKVGRKEEWPTWTPTAEIKRRLGNVPDFVEGGPHNPMGARGLYLYAGNKDTLFRIHGTNQPEHIGQAVSSGCIRMTNEDVIDLYKRVKMGSIVVVLAPEERRLAEQSAGRNGHQLESELLTTVSRGPGTAPDGGPAPFTFRRWRVAVRGRRPIARRNPPCGGYTRRCATSTSLK